MNTAIVTGATSYLGIELVARLTHENFKVHVIIRDTTNISRLIARVPDVNIHTHNGTQKNLNNIFLNVRPDIVFHLASKYVREEVSENVEALILSNILFGTQLLEASANCNVKRFINTGSYFQFSNGQRPHVNLYGAAKSAFTKILSYYNNLNKFYSTTLVIYDIYGPSDWRIKLFPNIAKAVKNKLPLSIPRNEIFLYPVYYADVLDCYLLAANKLIYEPEDISGKYYAVRDKTPCTISEIIEVFEKVSGDKVIVKKGGWPKPEQEIDNIWRGKTLSGWKPSHSLLDGIKSMLKE